MKASTTHISKFFFFLLIILVFGYFGFSFFYEKTLNISNLNTGAMLQATQLVKAYQTDESESNAMYREQVLEITGVISKVTFINNRNTVILQGVDNDTGVICDMNDDQRDSIGKLTQGQTIRIKGLCKGFLKDVILVNCILVKTPTNG